MWLLPGRGGLPGLEGFLYHIFPLSVRYLPSPGRNPWCRQAYSSHGPFHQLYVFWVHGDRAVAAQCCSPLLIFILTL